jgi:dephospho-CoA kinase
MLLVGLTGGIASGKSLVTRTFRDLGAHVIDADRIVHGLLSAGQGACREVAGHFGREVQLGDGSIDRKKLGEIVFRDAAERAWLNACLHPRVFEIFSSQVRRICQHDPSAMVIFDAALLIETGYHRRMDTVIVVYAAEEQQSLRLQARDRLTPEQAMERIRSQMPLEEKKRYADHVIDNTGTREQAERQARELFAVLQRRAGSGECSGRP